MRNNLSIVLLVFCSTLWLSCDDECELKDCGDNGEWNSSSCECDCYNNYTGEYCDEFVPEYSMHADVSVDGDPTFSFDPYSLWVEVIDNTQDTIWIDGFDVNNQMDDTDDDYLFFNIIVDDVTAITTPATYQISPTYNPGTSWSSFRLMSIDPAVYSPIDGSSGTITLTSFHINGEIGGSFDVVLFNGPSNVAITGYFLGDD